MTQIELQAQIETRLSPVALPPPTQDDGTLAFLAHRRMCLQASLNMVLGVPCGIGANRGGRAAYPSIGNWFLPQPEPKSLPAKFHSIRYEHVGSLQRPRCLGYNHSFAVVPRGATEAKCTLSRSTIPSLQELSPSSPRKLGKSACTPVAPQRTTSPI